MENAAANDFIFEMIGDKGVWLGGIKSKSTGKWNWIDSTPWNYTILLPYTSCSSVANDFCIGMQIETYKDWNEEPCHDRLYPICKKKVCPTGWIPFNSNCYKLFTEHLMWKNAMKKCNEAGGKLASVHSSEENMFILSMKTQAWIGGTFNAYKHEWTWSDGTAWNHTSWKRGEPNNLGGAEYCLEFVENVKGKWNDQDCANELPYICKISLTIDGKCLRIYCILLLRVQQSQ